MQKARLGVVYASGAAGIRDILASLGDDYDLVFIAPREADSILEALESFADTIPVSIPDGIGCALELIRRNKVEGLVTYSEHMLRLTAQLCEQLHLPGHDVATAMRLTNKKLQREALSAAGIPVPRNAAVYRAEDWSDTIASVGWPAIVKPLRGTSSAMTYPVILEEDAARLQRTLFGSGSETLTAYDSGYIVEQLLIGRDSTPFGDYVSVECRTVSGSTSLYGVTGTFPLATPFREPGQFWPCPLPREEQDLIFEMTRYAISALGITNGISHTEIKLTDDGPRIIEVNGRLGGFRADLALRHCGLDLIKDAAEIALGRADSANPILADGRPGVTYSYSSLPPGDARELVSITGRASVLRAPGVEAYHRFYGNGAKLAADGRSDPVDVILGHAPSFQEMIPLLRDQLDPLAYRFRSESDYVVKALDLDAASFMHSKSPYVPEKA